MQLPFSARWLLPMALLLGLVLRVPGWFTQDMKGDWVTFEPDEGQHVHIAITRYNDLQSGPDIGDYNNPPWNVRGFGHLMAYTAYVWYALADRPPGYHDFILLGRQLSTLFALLLTGKAEDARLLRAFQPRNVFPERVVYAYFFGNFETFLGKTLVYERVR